MGIASVFKETPALAMLACAVAVLMALLLVALMPRVDAHEAHLQPNTCHSKPMLAFELNSHQASKMFVDWPRAKAVLREALHWDFIFLGLYPALISMAAFTAGHAFNKAWGLPMTVTWVVIGMQLLAGLLDAVENLALLKVLDTAEAVAPLWPALARYCALMKFGLVIVGLIYAVLGILVLLFQVAAKRWETARG